MNADDDEPITTEWLRLAFPTGQVYFPTIWLGADVNVCDGAAWISGKKIADATTRGQVRGLAKKYGKPCSA